MSQIYAEIGIDPAKPKHYKPQTHQEQNFARVVMFNPEQRAALTAPHMTNIGLTPGILPEQALAVSS